MHNSDKKGITFWCTNVKNPITVRQCIQFVTVCEDINIIKALYQVSLNHWSLNFQSPFIIHRCANFYYQGNHLSCFIVQLHFCFHYIGLDNHISLHNHIIMYICVMFIVVSEMLWIVHIAHFRAFQEPNSSNHRVLHARLFYGYM